MTHDDVVGDNEHASDLIPFKGDVNLLSGAQGQGVPGWMAKGLRLSTLVVVDDDGSHHESHFVHCVAHDGEQERFQYLLVLDSLRDLGRFVGLVQHATVLRETGEMPVQGYEFTGAIRELVGTDAALTEDNVDGVRLRVSRSPEGHVSIVTTHPGKASTVLCALHAEMDATTLAALAKAHLGVTTFIEGMRRRITDHVRAKEAVAADLAVAMGTWDKVDESTYWQPLPPRTVEEAISGHTESLYIRRDSEGGRGGWRLAEGDHPVGSFIAGLAAAKAAGDERLERAQAEYPVAIVREAGLDPAHWEFKASDLSVGFSHGEEEVSVHHDDGRWVVTRPCSEDVTFDTLAEVVADHDASRSARPGP